MPKELIRKLRCTTPESEAWQAQAQSEGLNFSEWARRRLNVKPREPGPGPYAGAPSITQVPFSEQRKKAIDRYAKSHHIVAVYPPNWSAEQCGRVAIADTSQFAAKRLPSYVLVPAHIPEEAAADHAKKLARAMKEFVHDEAPRNPQGLQHRLATPDVGKVSGPLVDKPDVDATRPKIPKRVVSGMGVTHPVAVTEQLTGSAAISAACLQLGPSPIKPGERLKKPRKEKS